MDPGIYRKFVVERADGSSGADGKHRDCTYFVLDWKHDRFAVHAARAYAAACEAEYPALAEDLLRRASEAEAMWSDEMAEVWANVSDGGRSHLILAEQLLTSQAAKCGYVPLDDDSWMWTEGDAPRPTSGKCIACQRK